MFAWLGYTIWFGLFNITVRLPLWLLDSVVKIYKMITFALPSYLLFGISPGESFANALLPILFLRMAIISFFVFAILFALSAVRVQFQKSDQPSPISIAMKNSLLENKRKHKSVDQLHLYYLTNSLIMLSFVIKFLSIRPLLYQWINLGWRSIVQHLFFNTFPKLFNTSRFKYWIKIFKLVKNCQLTLIIFSF